MTFFQPEGSEPYVERWLVGRDSSTTEWPKSGLQRPGALDLLRYPHPGQRNTNQPRVRALKRALRRGFTPLSWDMLAVDTDGRLCNFFHRAMAIAETDIAMPTWVYLNVSEAAINIGDQGQVRNIRQGLKRLGYEHYDVLDPAARFLFRWLIGRGPGDRREPVTWDDVMLVLDEHPHLEGYCNIGRQIAAGPPKPGGRPEGGHLHSAGLGAMLAYLMCQVDPQGGPVFVQRWASPPTMGARDPLRHLTMWLSSQAAAAHGTKGGVDVTEKAAMAILARNADMLGERPEMIEWRKSRKDRAPVFPKLLWPDYREPLGDDDPLAHFAAMLDT